MPAETNVKLRVCLNFLRDFYIFLTQNKRLVSSGILVASSLLARKLIRTFELKEYTHMNRGRLHIISLCIGVAIFAALNVQTKAQIVTAQEYSGRATGINSTITTNGSASTVTSGDTCPLPPRGGTSTVTVTGGPLIQGILGSGTISSSTSGAGITSQSSSNVADFFLNAGGFVIRAANVASSTQCNCCDISAPMCSSTSSVSGLTVTDPSGANIAVSTNGTATIPGAGTIVFNERISSGVHELTVNAMHINFTVNGTTYNVIVASSHSDIVCPGIVITAAEASISGRVVDQNGTGISRATVSITNSQGTVVKTTTSNETGAYTLTGIQSGSTYIISAMQRSYVFTPRSVNVLDDITGFNLTGLPR